MDSPGRELGRYRLLRLLGFGGMGEVYLASSRGAAGFEKLVTVKILRQQMSQDPARIGDLMREAFIGVRLDHENIVQVFDLGEQDGTYFLVMEYVRGFSLREVVSFAAEQNEKLPVRQAVHAVRRVADALDYVHKVRGPHRRPLGLIHRDVSPSNVLLGAEGRIKLSDFGVAGMIQDPQRAGMVIGKPRYLPPDARHGMTATQGWDIYALGVVLHSALSGDPDIEASGAAGATVIGGRLRPLKEARPDLPQALIDLVEHATARTPEARLEDAATFRARLDAVVPREVDDGDQWRAWLQDLYRREPFVGRFGTLPFVEDLIPDIAPHRPTPPSVAYIETVVVDAARPVKFGMSPALGAAVARAAGDRVAAWLRKRLDRDVKSIVLGDYQALVDAVADGEVDFAWMPPVPIVRAIERGAGVLGTALRYGRATYESAIVVRPDSPIQTLEDLRGKRIAFVDKDSAGGHLYAADLISRELGPIEEVVAEQHFTGSHKAACEAVQRGWLDAAATYVVSDTSGTLMHAGWREIPELRELGELRAIRISDPIPGDGVAHRPGLAPALIERGANIVVDIASSDAEGAAILREVFRVTSMVRSELRIYEPVRELLARRPK
ncbi:MAG TPA: serine/threonine-protein kinase [Kofleriaceae bacterium]